MTDKDGNTGSSVEVDPGLGYPAFDSDNHYYEAEDAFTRHLPKAFKSRGMRWVEMDGRKKVLLGGTTFNLIPNPTFDPCAKPGCLSDYYKGEVSGDQSIMEMMGELDIPKGSRGEDVLSELDLLSAEQKGSGMITGDTRLSQRNRPTKYAPLLR